MDKQRMPIRQISSGSEFEALAAYSRAIVDGDYVFVSGTTGYDYGSMTLPDDVLAQAEQCFVNIGHALAEAGSGFEDIVRITYMLPRREDFRPCWPILRKYLGEVRPAATMIVADLMEPEMKIEIEVTARKR